MLQNFTQVNNFPPQVSSCNPSVVSYMCACCCLFLCRMLCLLFLFFCLVLFVQKKVKKLGSEWKKKHLGWSFVEKRGPETAKKKIAFLVGKKGNRQNPFWEPPSFQGEPPKLNTLVFVED